MSTINIRKRKQPSRYGHQTSALNSSSETDEKFADNSMDDPNYDPSEKKRARFSDVSNDSHSTYEEENFDKEFDQIEVSDANNTNSVNERDHSIQSPTGEGSSLQKSTPAEDSPDSPLDTKYIRNMLMVLHENSLQILTRIAVIEDSLLKSDNLITTKTVKTEKNAFAKYYTFSKSHGLPMKSIDEIKEFEKRLSDTEFQDNTITSFSDFPGMKSMRGNKAKLLKTVLYKFVTNSLFATFTWTGKAGRGRERKNALKNFPNILKVLQAIVKKLEGEYEEEMFLDHLKNKIIKRAYEHAPKASNSEQIRNGEFTESDEVRPSAFTRNIPGRPKDLHSTTKLQPSTDTSCFEAKIEQVKYSDGPVLKMIPTPNDMNTNTNTHTVSTIVYKATDPRLRVTNENFSEKMQYVNTVEDQNYINSLYNNVFRPYKPNERASAPKSKVNYSIQPSESPENVLYGSTFESQNIQQFHAQYKTDKPNVHGKAPEPISQFVANQNNSHKILNLENSRGKYLLSLAQSYKNL